MMEERVHPAALRYKELTSYVIGLIVATIVVLIALIIMFFISVVIHL